MDAIDFWFWPWTTLGNAVRADPASERAEPQWTSENSVALELEAMRLRDFSRAPRRGPTTLVIAPFALHDAGVADLSPGHSLIGALLAHGGGRVFLLEWKSATASTKLRTIDSCLSDLNVALDDIGPPLDLVGLCQGGWLALVYAARFPQKVRRLALVGAPVDVTAEPSAFSQRLRATPQAAVAALVQRGNGLARGDVLQDLWPWDSDVHALAAKALQLSTPQTEAECAALQSFLRWRKRTLDLPGPYYMQVVQWVFRENRIARGCFPALGRSANLRELRRPMFLLAGAEDMIAPAKQALAAAALTGAREEEIEIAIAPCGHLALFMGRETIENEWRRIAAWLSQ
jgi:poly(3-hydroxyalkanoate) synthetase